MSRSASTRQRRERSLRASPAQPSSSRDDSNETRALLLLQQEGLIKLPDDASAEKGVNHLDIVDDGGYNVTPVQADTVPSVLASSDAGTIAVINGNYALAGLKVADALAIEDASGDAAPDLREHHRRPRGRRDQRKDPCFSSRLSSPTLSRPSSPTATTARSSQYSKLPKYIYPLSINAPVFFYKGAHKTVILKLRLWHLSGGIGNEITGIW